MRFYMLPALLIIAGCGPVKIEENGTTEQVAAPFDADLKRHLAAVTGRDLAALAPTLADDVDVIFPDGSRIEGKEAVLDFHREWFADDQWRYDAEIIATEAGNNLASALVRYTYRDAPDGPPRQTWLALQFRHTQAGWQLYHDQNTRISE